MRRIEDQIALIASRDAFVSRAPIVGAGVGRGVIAAWARRTGREFHDFDEFIPTTPEARAAASDCAPACAVALLASDAQAANGMTTLLYALEDTGSTIGLESMCVGGGQGMAMIVERLS